MKFTSLVAATALVAAAATSSASAEIITAQLSYSSGYKAHPFARDTTETCLSLDPTAAVVDVKVKAGYTFAFYPRENCQGEPIKTVGTSEGVNVAAVSGKFVRL
ncbi:hypothetical protein H9P43_001948 [Blastocladiella emersonii ATCC 22665]|nr:hypothetical protein H9P43_001948 [Blastocladiella emersonii ATCC 22665]